MKVCEYMTSMIKTKGNRRVRVLNAITKKYLGAPADFMDRYVVGIKVTTKYIFIFI